MKTIITLCLLVLLCAGCTPKVGNEPGNTPIEINAAEWFNAGDGGVTLASLAGKVVVVEFWATWCPPCRKSVPHLVELSTKYKDKGVVIIGLTDENYTKANIAKFMTDMKMNYRVGTGSTSDKDYGVAEIPTAFVIGKKGTILWKGHPMDGLEKRIEDALREKTPASPSADKPAAKTGGT